jgi:predicted DNA-binding protein
VTKRNGRPLVVYFSQEQAERLASVSQRRCVAKADLVRFAVDRLLNQLNSGQLELPLGI